MCGGGGAGGSGTQKYEWNDNIAPFWQEQLELGNALRQRGYQQYGGERIAGLAPDQEDAMNNIRHFVNSPQGFLYGKGNTEFQKTLAGDYLTGEGANPFSTNNAYEGDNPYFRQTVNTTLEDMANQYKQGTQAETDRMFTMAGTFGGDAHQKTMANNQAALAKQMGNTAQSMYSGQYDRSAGLYENYLNRGSQNFEGERGRMMGAGQASQADQGLTLQRYNAQMGVGDITRGLNQDYLNQYYNDWQNQQGHEYKMADWMSGLLGRAQGGMSPNMTFTQPGTSASPFSQLMGAGLMGYGMFGGK